MNRKFLIQISKKIHAAFSMTSLKVHGQVLMRVCPPPKASLTIEKGASIRDGQKVLDDMTAVMEILCVGVR